MKDKGPILDPELTKITMSYGGVYPELPSIEHIDNELRILEGKDIKRVKYKCRNLAEERKEP